MADIPSTNSKIQIEETTYRAPVSETLTQRMGGSINYALDQVSTTSGALAAETAARIAADNTINNKVVVRQTSTGFGNYSFGNNSIYADGALIDEENFVINYTSNANNWMLLQIQADPSNTGAPRTGSYLQIDLLSDLNFGTQRAYTFTLAEGENFGTILYPTAFSNPLTIRLRCYAGGSFSGSGQRWTWDARCRYTILNAAAVFGA
jgi:hypothetical protein